MSVSKNDITGDSLTSRTSTQQYRDGWDRIFNKESNDEPLVVTVNIPTPTTKMTEVIKETEIIIHPNECENIVGDGVELFCLELANSYPEILRK